MEKYDDANKRAMAVVAGTAARLVASAAKQLLLWLAGLLAPYLIPLAVIILLVFFVYSVLFLVPRAIMDDFKGTGANTEVVSFFNGGTLDTWTLEFDRELKRQYDQLGEGWSKGLETTGQLAARLGPDWQGDIDEGYIASEYEQAKSYRLPWAVLAGVDRVAGDPVITGKRDYSPRPRHNYEVLQPEFTWLTVTATKTIQEEVEHTRTATKKINGQQVSVEETYTTLETRTVTARLRLLTEVKGYDATYQLEYQPKTVTRGTAGKNQRVLEAPTLQTVQQRGPYFIRLIDLMNSYRITDPLDVELVLQLAMTYDDSYAADFNLLGMADYGFSIDLTQQYWQGPAGTRTAPLPLEFMHNVTSPFGMRLHPVLRKYKLHTGLDLVAPNGTPVFAFQNGLVIYAGKMGGYGLAVVVDHGSFKTMYGHLSRIMVKINQEVASGEQLGEVGRTGLSTGPHLHFEVQELAGGWSKPVDPVKYFQ